MVHNCPYELICTDIFAVWQSALTVSIITHMCNEAFVSWWWFLQVKLPVGKVQYEVIEPTRVFFHLDNPTPGTKE